MTGKATIVSECFNMCLSVTEISKKIENLNHLIDQFDQRDKHGTLHPTSTEYTLLSETHGMLTKVARFPITKQVLTTVEGLKSRSACSLPWWNCSSVAER